ncbi:nitrate- and nitrite sensing domain-containing protein [Streptomyces sp. NBC_00083]|uniref:nitrate- and nitrite sensing domain-containing protein n=1 Tax=Streptomyces sp. NBC_00083 TaxID=2975647 RepID=UPI002259EB73|nr:nitrate- and nitrite sensing domain-containing protein [Streptomyces sp. NBC_00083]MCX5383659.1 nitrate- and nitrite sensing domain-containing protein [Streptomyces sp. NBC_00083]
MRFRGKSIRRKIVALLLVPLVSLTALWGFSTYLTGRQAGGLMDVARIVKKVGYPLEDTVRDIQQERRQTLVYLADERPADALTSLRGRRAATDAGIARIRAAARDSDIRGDLQKTAKTHLKAALAGFDTVVGLRHSIEQGTVDRTQALEYYNRLIDPCYGFLMNLHPLENVEMDKQSRALVGVNRAREMLSREDALVASSLITPKTTTPELRRVSDLVANRELLYDTNLELLPNAERERFQQYWNGPDTEALRTAEAAVIDAGPARNPHHIDAARWQQAVTPVLDHLAQMGTEAGNRYQDRVEPVAFDVLIKAGLAGVLGFLALLISLFMSVRIGRGLVRDLTRLRKEAHEASGVRLPSVMRRLAAGETVDVETEAPRLDYERDEVGQVGQALNTLQRAAVEAAVKQADMRRGVSEVFVNLARRNQVLLHRQLTLLDTMERRTEDTDELADLFRLDHLTTRMRRHAEGLVILSGAAPSRQWRKPVQLMDVVRAAVAEVEDYERIEVRRLPRLGVGGPAVADLTHLIAELLENATVFSPPHTAVQVHGERVANGFTLEIHDRGLGMTPEMLLDANLRLAETPEFELSDTDRLGLFVVSRLAQRQNVRVSLQPSPYGGTTAVVFLPATLLTDAPETDGTGFRLDRGSGRAEDDRGAAPPRRALSPLPVGIPGQSVLDGPVELEPPLDPLGLDEPSVFEAPSVREGGEPGRGGLLRSAHRAAEPADEGHQHQQTADEGDEREPLPLPRRHRVPTLVSDNGRRVDGPGRGHPAPDAEPSPEVRRAFESRLPERRPTQPQRPQVPRASAPRPEPASPQPPHPAPRPSGLTPVRPTGLDQPPAAPPPGLPGPPSSAPSWGSLPGGPGESAPGEPLDGLPRRVRQASLAPQLKDAPDGHRPAPGPDSGPEPERDADEVRDRMAALQRGWQRGRRHNEASDTAEGPSAPDRGDTARRTTPEGDGR